MYELPSQKPSGGRSIKIFYSNQSSNKTMSKYSTIGKKSCIQNPTYVKVIYYQLKVSKVKPVL